MEEGAERGVGRRTVTHEYPNRDTCFVEDLGLQTEIITIRGFLIGDNVYEQRDYFKAQCRIKGAGQLVHPSLGTFDANLIGAGFSEDWREGRVVSMDLQFIAVANQNIQNLTPIALTNTQSTVVGAAASLKDASSDDFFSEVGAAIKSGERSVNAVVDTVSKYVNQAQRLLNDATRAVNLVKGVGNIVTGGRLSFGRYGNGFLSAPQQGLNLIKTGLTDVRALESGVNSAMALATTTRTDVISAYNSVSSFASSL